MRIPPGIIQDDVLFRFLRSRGVLVHIALNHPFLVRLDDPVPVVGRSTSNPSVIHFDGYRQLAIRRAGSQVLEVGYIHGRRADMADAVWVAQAARPLAAMRDVETVRDAIGAQNGQGARAS